MRSLKKIAPFSDFFFLKVLSFKEMRAIFALTIGQESVKWYAVAALYKWQVVTVGWGVLIGGPSSTVAVKLARPTRHVQMRLEHTTKQKTEWELNEMSYRYTDYGAYSIYDSLVLVDWHWHITLASLQLQQPHTFISPLDNHNMLKHIWYTNTSQCHSQWQ